MSYDFEPRTVTLAPEKAGSGEILVVIRYPTAVDQPAAELFQRLYENRGFTNVFFNPPEDVVIVPWEGQHGAVAVGHQRRKKEMIGSHLEAMTKSLYFALDYYVWLRERLPADSIRLVPTVIRRDEYQAEDVPSMIPPRPLLIEDPGTVMPPAALYVDVFAYVHPYWRLDEGTTFGRSFVPVITVRTAPDVSRTTGGLIATMEPLMPYVRRPRAGVGASGAAGVSYVDYLNATPGIPADNLVGMCQRL